jgi:heme/copper-type cytochrome/quinol oxidase subunit 2
MLLATFILAAASAAAPASVPAVETRSFAITAERFKFEPATLEVNEGDLVRLTFRSADTTHGFELKEYDLKLEIPKDGESVTVEFVADKPGRFVFACSEYCGIGHRGMRGRLVVAPRAR